MKSIERIDIEGITIPSRARPLDSHAVKTLMQSIEKIGLRTPITVRGNTADDFSEIYLVSGHHRLQACKMLGMETIDAFIAEDVSEDQARLWEIAENLHRSELTALERSEHIAEWVRLSEAVSLQVATKPQGGRPESGVRRAGRELGIESTAAYRAVVIDGLTDDAKAEARALGLDDNQAALRKAASAEPAQQASVVREIAERKASRIDADIRDRAANEVAQMIAEHVPGEWWDAIKSNLYAAGANNIANALTNVTGQSIMDKNHG